MSRKLTIELSSKWLITTLIIVLITAVGWLAYRALQPTHTGPIPQAIAGQLDFTPFVIRADATGYKQASFKYASVESDTKILSYIISLPNGTTVIASEYPQPPEFYEIQDYKAKFLENKSEDTVLTDNGTIYLSHPEKQKDTQIGLMLEKGLILFFNPSKNLDKTEWRALGNNLTIQRTK